MDIRTFALWFVHALAVIGLPMVGWSIATNRYQKVALLRGYAYIEQHTGKFKWRHA